MYQSMGRRVKVHSIIISIFLLMLIASSFEIVSIQSTSVQASQVNSEKDNNVNSLNVQNIPIKKVQN
jgi:hypothetical protein